jgi:hypothetical protein
MTEMREVDRRTIEMGIPGVVLMENAAHRLVEFLAEQCAPLAGERIVVQTLKSAAARLRTSDVAPTHWVESKNQLQPALRGADTRVCSAETHLGAPVRPDCASERGRDESRPGRHECLRHENQLIPIPCRQEFRRLISPFRELCRKRSRGRRPAGTSLVCRNSRTSAGVPTLHARVPAPRLSPVASARLWKISARQARVLVPHGHRSELQDEMITVARRI